MRRRTPIVIGALAFAGVAVASGARAQVADPIDPPESSSTTASTRAPTTTTPPVTPSSTSSTTSTTARPSSGASTTTTTVKGGTTTTSVLGRGPIPPPPSGASQPLDPSLLGGVGPVELNPSTTIVSGLFGTESGLSTTTTTFVTDNAINVASSSDGPSGGMLGLAAVAWLASLGGLLVYAEDQRGKQWRHLAR